MMKENLLLLFKFIGLKSSEVALIVHLKKSDWLSVVTY